MSGARIKLYLTFNSHFYFSSCKSGGEYWGSGHCESGHGGPAGHLARLGVQEKVVLLTNLNNEKYIL